MIMRMPLYALLLTIVACNMDPVQAKMTADSELQIRPAVVRTITGDSAALTAVAFTGAGNPVFTGPVTWRSLDPTTVTVSTSGGVQALTAGWGRVVARATDSEKEDTATIAVGLRLADIAVGSGVACGLTEDGVTWCWDQGYYDYFGVGKLSGEALPGRIPGDLHFEKLSTGYNLACGVASGEVYCWGYGAGTGCYKETCLTPHPLRPAIVDASYLDVNSHPAICATGADGLECRNGDESACDRCSPVARARLPGPLTLRDYFGCGLAADGQAWCWGDAHLGQLGRVIPPELCVRYHCEQEEPVAVNTPERFENIVSGSTFACGLTAYGRAFCWGSYERFPELHQNVSTPGASPVRISSTLRFESIAAGDAHVCGIEFNGQLYCWGSASSVIAGPRQASGEPRLVAPGTKFTRVAAGGGSACAIAESGVTFCMGSGAALGQGSRNFASRALVPIMPPGPLPSFVTLNAHW
jgi:hypothetical protein